MGQRRARLFGLGLILGAICGPGRLQSQVPSDNPRDIAASALKAAEQGTLHRWVASWNARMTKSRSDRPALFAVASAERLRYRYSRADSLYARVIALNASDVLARQAQLARITLSILRGQQADAPTKALVVVNAALRNADTLTALDALLLRAATILRTEGVAAAMETHARGDTLSWKREPALDAASRCQLAFTRSSAGARDEARRLAREGEAIASRAQLERLAARCLFILTTEFARAGLTDSLRPPMHRAMEIQARTGDMAGLAATAQWAGYYMITLGSFPNAQRYLNTAWDAAQQAQSVDAKAWTALNRALLAMAFYDGASARKWLALSDTYMRSLGDLNGSIQVARLRSRLALTTGDTASAHAHLRRANALAKGLGDPQATMLLLSTASDLAIAEGRLDDAVRISRQEDSLITQYAMSGWRLSRIAFQGALELRRGNGREAERLLKSVIDSVHPSQTRYRNELEVQLALAMAMSGDIHGAARVAMQTAMVFDKWRASISDNDLRLLTVQSQRGNGSFMSALIARLADGGEVEVAFSLGERRRARDLRDRLLQSSAWRQPALTNVPGGVHTWGESDSVDIRAMQRALPDAMSAVVTMDAGEGGERGTAFVITRDSISAHALPSTDAVAPRVRRLVSLLEAGRDETSEARAVGNMLMSPLMSRLEKAGITRIVFVPEGVLHRLPFDVVRLADGRAVIDRFETAVAPSATVLSRLQSSAQGGRTTPSALAIADPVSAGRGRKSVDADSSIGARLLATLFGTRALPQLPGARDEVNRVKRALPGTVIRTGNLASEAVFKRDASTFDVLHFATHAVVDEWSGAQAALALTAGDGEDGLLESGEISLMRLNASLVVLSACRTVGGEVLAGEGVRGLTTAFLQAGARTVVATSWRVNDRGVVPLVDELYRALARGVSTGTALRRARLNARANGAPASVWGAFSIVGDPWRTLAASN